MDASKQYQQDNQKFQASNELGVADDTIVSYGKIYGMPVKIETVVDANGQHLMYYFSHENFPALASASPRPIYAVKDFIYRIIELNHFYNNMDDDHLTGDEIVLRNYLNVNARDVSNAYARLCKSLELHDTDLPGTGIENELLPSNPDGTPNWEDTDHGLNLHRFEFFTETDIWYLLPTIIIDTYFKSINISFLCFELAIRWSKKTH